MPTINNLKDRDPKLLKIATEIVEFTEKHNLSYNAVSGPHDEIGIAIYAKSDNIEKYIEVDLNSVQHIVDRIQKSQYGWTHIKERFTNNIEDIKSSIKEYLL